MSQLIIKQEYLIAKSVITNNTDFKYLTPVIKWVQDIKLKKILGTNLFNEIITQSTPPTSLTTANQYLIDTFILDFMVLYITSQSVMPLRYKHTNIGLTINDSTGNGVTAASEGEAREVMDFYKNMAEDYGQEMINYIKGNPALYPAYFTNTGIGNIQPEGDSYDVQIYLPNNNPKDFTRVKIDGGLNYE